MRHNELGLVQKHRCQAVVIQSRIYALNKLFLYDAQRGKKALMQYPNSKGPDERAHPSSLIWTFSDS